MHPYLEFWKATAMACAKRCYGAACRDRSFLAPGPSFSQYSRVWICSSWRDPRRSGDGWLGGHGHEFQMGWAVARTPHAGGVRRTVAVAVLVAMLSLAFFRLVPSIPVRPNSIRHLLILLTLFSALVVRGQLYRLGDPAELWCAQPDHHHRFGDFVLVVGAGWMNRSGEDLPFPVPPLASRE